MPLISRFILLLGVLLVSACAQQAPAFAPPSERPLAANEKPWPKNHVLGIAYHDVEDRDPDQAVVAVRTERMICPAWALERRTNTCGRSAPGSSRELGVAPVASTAAL